MDDDHVICLCTNIRAKDKVSLFLCYLFTYFDNRLLPKNIIIIRNYGDDDGVLKNRHRGGEDQQGTSNPSYIPKQYQIRVHLGFQNLTSPKLTSWSHTESDLDVLYMVRTRIS
jgi:hypothetical protein